MMHRSLRLLSLLLSLTALINTALAKPVDQATASQLAREVLGTGQGSARSLEHLQLTERPAYYIYQVGGGGGFALIAKDDTAGALIGYSHRGSFDLERMPQSLRELFSTLDKPLSERRLGQEARAFDYPPKHGRAIQPLLSSNWGQGHPYSLYTPTYTDSDGDQQHMYAGCVAVAMAQVMYFHKWPNEGTGSRTHSQLGYRDFSASHYRWSDMRPSYGDRERYIGSGNSRRVRPDDDPIFTSVAQLMADLGVSVAMGYTEYASSTSSEMAAAAFQTYFKYDATSALSASTLGITTIERLIREELEAGFPVYVSGLSRSGGKISGHAWVIDGMDARGLFHMNFGWDGSSDSFFSLRHIAPGQAGNEFGGRKVNFSQGIQIILAHPKRPGTAPLSDEAKRLGAGGLSSHYSALLRLRGTGGFKRTRTPSIDVEFGGFINKGLPFTGDYGYGLYDAQERLIRIYPSKYHSQGGFTKAKLYGSMVDGQYISEDMAEQDRLDISGLPAGIYALRPLSSRLGEDGSWGPWQEILYAPTLGLRLTESEIEVIEEDGFNRGFQIMESLRQPKLCAGDEVRLPILLKHLGATSRDTQLALRLYDEAGQLIEGFREPSPVKLEFTPMETHLVHLPLSLPETLRAGRYRLALEVKDGEGSTTYPTQLYQLREENFLTVSAPFAERLQAFDARILDRRGQEVTSYPVDLTQGANPRLEVSVKTPPSKPIGKELGTLRLYLEDPTTGHRTLIGTEALKTESPFYVLTTRVKSEALTQELLGGLSTGKAYRVVAEVTFAGEVYDAWAPDEKAIYLTFVTGRKEEASPTPEIHPAHPTTEVEPTPDPAPKPQPDPEPKPEPAPEPQPSPEPQPVPDPQPTPPPTPKPLPEPEPQPKEEEAAPALRYFPTESRVEVSGKELLRLEVFDLMGRRCIHQPLSGVSRASLSLAPLPQGIYLVRVLDGGSYTTHRLAR